MEGSSWHTSVRLQDISTPPALPPSVPSVTEAQQLPDDANFSTEDLEETNTAADDSGTIQQTSSLLGSGSAGTSQQQEPLQGRGVTTAKKRKKREAGRTLSRNQACKTCRTRKVRCDAAKPGCGACRKSASVQNRDPDAVVCEYEPADEASSVPPAAAPELPTALHPPPTAPTKASFATVVAAVPSSNRRESISVRQESGESATKKARRRVSYASGADGSPSLSNTFSISTSAGVPMRSMPESSGFPNAFEPGNGAVRPVGLVGSAQNAPATTRVQRPYNPFEEVEASFDLPLGNQYSGGDHLQAFPPFDQTSSSYNLPSVGSRMPTNNRTEYESSSQYLPAIHAHLRPNSQSLNEILSSTSTLPTGATLSSVFGPPGRHRPPDYHMQGGDQEELEQMPSMTRFESGGISSVNNGSYNEGTAGDYVPPDFGTRKDDDVPWFVTEANVDLASHFASSFQDSETMGFENRGTGDAVPRVGESMSEFSLPNTSQARTQIPVASRSNKIPVGFAPNGQTSPRLATQAPLRIGQNTGSLSQSQNNREGTEAQGTTSKPNNTAIDGRNDVVQTGEPPTPSTSAPSPDSTLWPISLPSHDLVWKLCNIFFSKRFVGQDLINKPKFFANLSLPPSHREFPHVALLHAVCAVATQFVDKDTFGLSSETYWTSEVSPTDYHAAMAKQLIDSAMVKGEKLFSVAQAIILICFYSYTSARFVEVWLYCGLATRICSPLGLNHLEGLIDSISSGIYANISGEAFFRKPDKMGMRGPQTEEEKQEHAHVFWLAFTADRLAAACTGWALSLAEEEVSTLLPKPTGRPGPVQQITPQEMEQLSLSSSTFFTSNSLPLVNAANLQYKSVVLLGRVCSFLRGAAWPVGSDIVKTARFINKGGKPSLSDVANSPEFKRLDALIVAFRLSFPKEYKNVLKRDHEGIAETALITAHVIPHASTILLHEAFCLSADDLAMQRCLSSARSILSIIYLLWGSTQDISLLQPFITFCYAVAGRTLIRDLAFKREVDDELGAATLSQEINVILSALTTFADRSPLANVIANSLRSLFADPDSCHPRRNGGLAMTRVCEESKTVVANTPTSTGMMSNSDHSTSNSELTAATTVGRDGQSKSASAPDSPSFSGLLWEMEQPGFAIGHNETFKNMELDLRELLGASYDQLLAA